MLYTGITTDITRRLAQHRTGKGAKALRGKGKLALVYLQQVDNKSNALKQEYQIKQWNKQQKERWLRQQIPHPLLHSLNAQ